MRPNQLWIADLTYVATWRGYVAFVIGVFSRRIVGLAGVDLAAQRPGARCVGAGGLRSPLIQAEPLVHHSDRGVTPVHGTVPQAGIESSVGSTGDSYDNALPETVIRLFKTRRRTVEGLEDIEFATLSGSHGTTVAACSNRSVTFRRPSSRRPTMTVRPHQSAWRFSQ